MENYAVTAGKFVCPPDFTETINTEGLCLEDIADDNELFIIQAPADVDLTKLHNQQLVLKNEPTTFYYPSEGGQQESYMCTTAVADKQLAKACLVLPERNSLQLCAVEKCIQGVVHIEKRIAFPQIGYPKELCDKIKEPENLKKQSDSLSSSTSTVLSDGYNKKKSSEDSAYLQRANGLSFQSVAKNNHKKHLAQDTGSSEDIILKSGTKHKNKRDQVVHIQAEEAVSNDRCSDDDSFGDAGCKGETSMHPKKKKKHRGDNVSHEVKESELSEKINEIESHEHSPNKPHKKKHTAIDSSSTDPQFVDSLDYRKHDKTKHKSDKPKKLSSKDNYDNHSSSSAPVYKIKEETEDDATEANSCVKQLSETSFGELSTSAEKRSKKGKKKKVNSDYHSSVYISHKEAEEETNDSHVLDVNNSNRDQLSEIGSGELSSPPEKKSKKKKKKKDISDDQNSNSYISNYEIKKEIDYYSGLEGNSAYADCHSGISYGDFSIDKKKKSKKKKKDESVS